MRGGATLAPGLLAGAIFAALAIAGATLAALALAGCGGVRAADLFLVERHGSTPGARLTLLVGEDGTVHCNGRRAPTLDDAMIVRARGIQEDLHDPASRHLTLPSRPGSVLSYSVRDEAGTVRFSDNSPAQPSVLRQLALFVLQVSQDSCHLPE